MIEKIKSDVFYEGFLMLRIYCHHFHQQKKTYYDVVLFRKIKGDTGSRWKRGANLKPTDLPDLARLVSVVSNYFEDLNVSLGVRA